MLIKSEINRNRYFYNRMLFFGDGIFTKIFVSLVGPKPMVVTSGQ